MISHGFMEKSNQGDCEDFAGIGGESCDETEKEPGKTLDFTAIGSRKCEHEAVMCVGTYTLRGEVRKWPAYVCIAAECGCTCELRGFLSADTRIVCIHTGCFKKLVKLQEHVVLIKRNKSVLIKVGSNIMSFRVKRR